MDISNASSSSSDEEVLPPPEISLTHQELLNFLYRQDESLALARKIWREHCANLGITEVHSLPGWCVITAEVAAKVRAADKERANFYVHSEAIDGQTIHTLWSLREWEESVYRVEYSKRTSAVRLAHHAAAKRKERQKDAIIEIFRIFLGGEKPAIATKVNAWWKDAKEQEDEFAQIVADMSAMLNEPNLYIPITSELLNEDAPAAQIAMAYVKKIYHDKEQKQKQAIKAYDKDQIQSTCEASSGEPSQAQEGTGTHDKPPGEDHRDISGEAGKSSPGA